MDYTLYGQKTRSRRGSIWEDVKRRQSLGAEDLEIADVKEVQGTKLTEEKEDILPATAGIIERIQALHSRIKPEVEALEAKKVIQRFSTAEYLEDQVEINHLKGIPDDQRKIMEHLGCDYGTLHDIKSVFDVTRMANGRPGIPEKDFKTMIGPVMCPSYPEGVTSWYNLIDTDGSGSIDWPKLSAYLVAVCNATTESLEIRTKPLRYNELARGRHAKSPGYRLLRLLPNQATNSFFAWCSDSSIRDFSVATLKPKGIIHHHDGATPIDMKYLEDKGYLYTATNAGDIFIYDITGPCKSTGNIAKALRTGAYVPGTGIETIVKTVKYDPLRMMLPPTDQFNPKREFVKVPVPLTHLMPRPRRCICTTSGDCRCGHRFSTAHSALRCFDTAQDSTRDITLFTGYESGYVAWHKCDMLTTDPVQPVQLWRPHNDWVTQVMHHTQHNELAGVMTSSLDGSILITDLARMEPYICFKDTPDTSGDGGGWLNGKRPVVRFDVADSTAIVASCGHMRGITFWSGHTRKRIATVHDHKTNVIDVKFYSETNQVVSIGEDRTVRIWDMRNFKPIQTIVEREHIASLMIDRRNEAIVCGSQVALSYSKVDEDNLKQVAAAPELNETVTGVIASVSHNQVISSDGRSITGWDMETGAARFAIKFKAAIAAWTLGDAENKIVTITNDGNIYFTLYGSSKPARTYTLSVTQPRSVMHLITINGESLVGCGMNEGSVAFFSEKTTKTSLPLHTMAPLTTKQDIDVGAVTNLEALNSYKNMFCAGTDRGFVVVIQLQQAGPVTTFFYKFENITSNVGANNLIVRASTAAAESRKPALRPVTGHLWKRVLEATKKERALSSADFTKFRHDAQVQMKLETESIVSFWADANLSCTCFGNGELLLFRQELPSGKNTVPLAFIPASSTSGAACAASTYKNRLFVADDAGVIAVFEMYPKTSIKTPGGSRYFCNIRMEMVYCVRLSMPVVGISAQSESICAVVIDAPRPCAIDLANLELLWGPRIHVAKAKNHRYNDYFPQFVGDDALEVPLPEFEMDPLNRSTRSDRSARSTRSHSPQSPQSMSRGVSPRKQGGKSGPESPTGFNMMLAPEDPFEKPSLFRRPSPRKNPNAGTQPATPRSMNGSMNASIHAGSSLHGASTAQVPLLSVSAFSGVHDSDPAVESRTGRAALEPVEPPRSYDPPTVDQKLSILYNRMPSRAQSASTFRPAQRTRATSSAERETAYAATTKALASANAKRVATRLGVGHVTGSLWYRNLKLEPVESVDRPASALK